MRPDTAPASRPVAGTAAMVRTRGGRAIGQPRLATKRTKTRNPRNPLLTERFSCVQCFGVSWRRVDGLWMLKFLPRLGSRRGNSCVVVLQRADAESFLPQRANRLDRGGGARQRGDAGDFVHH